MAFNVNAARAQRLEAKGAQFAFTVDDETFTIPTELDRGVLKELRALPQDDLDGVLSAFLGAEQFARLQVHALSVQDVKAVLDEYRSVSGLNEGEGSPSAS